MKVMVIGGGGREHAVIKALRKNSSIDEIFALPGNGGIAEDAICVDIGATQTDEITDFAVKNKIDYAVVTPDDPLARASSTRLPPREYGVSDRLRLPPK